MVDDDRADEKDGEGNNTPAPGTFHDRLPPPPDFNYSRPSLGKTYNTGSTNKLSESSGSNQSVRPGAASLGRSLAAGTVAITSPLGGAIVGLIIDTHFVKHGSMLWTIVLTLLGVVSGFMSMFRILGVGKRDRK